LTDILLNVFLAIAVDNLADAESLSAIEKEEGEADGEGEGEGEGEDGKKSPTSSMAKEGEDNEGDHEADASVRKAEEDGSGAENDGADEMSKLARTRSKKKQVETLLASCVVQTSADLHNVAAACRPASDFHLSRRSWRLYRSCRSSLFDEMSECNAIGWT
jgi:hypothetical protein